MHSLFDDVFTRPENAIFQVVFFPDRVYHARYLNATRSARYRYNVREVRSQSGLMALKGEVYLDGLFLTTFVRIEYRGERLQEGAREHGRFVRDEVRAWLRFRGQDGGDGVEATVTLSWCPWIGAHQVEIWRSLDAPGGTRHDFKVLDLMGRDGAITRVPALAALLEEPKAIRQIEIAVREALEDRPLGYLIPEDDVQWDNNFGRSFQVPNVPEPSSPQNTVSVQNYLLDFQRGFFLDCRTIEPVRYLNAMMDDENPDRRAGNVTEMRWIVQRALGSTNVFFHEVTIAPGVVEGTHWHIGTEELYYIVDGEGTAYLGENDDPALAGLPTVQRHVMGVGFRPCKEVRVRGGHVIFTKSGGIHGIRNDSQSPLRFVAFLYHSS